MYDKIVSGLEKALDDAYEAFGEDQMTFHLATEEIVQLAKLLKETPVPQVARPEVIRRLKAKGMERKKHGCPMCFWELETALAKLK